MSATFVHRAVIELVRNLLEGVPKPSRSLLCRELASSLLALSEEQRQPSGLMQQVIVPDDVDNGDK